MTTRSSLLAATCMYATTLMCLPTFAIGVPSTPAPAVASPNSRFLVLSDFHLDPYYGRHGARHPCTDSNSPKFGAFSCDAPMSLVDFTLQSAAAVIPNPDFIIVLGDYVRHNMQTTADGKSVVEVIRSITLAIEKYFPKAKQLHGLENILGNNDFVGDYEFAVDPRPAHDTVYDWTDRLARQTWAEYLSDDQKTQFSHGGFYTMQPVPGLSLLSINTIPYSNQHTPKSSNLDDPMGQFDWMAKTLAQIRTAGGKVYILGHIPPVVDSHGHKPLWESKYVEKYLALVDSFVDVIAGQMFGHTHTDEFRTFDLNRPAGKLVTPLLLTSSISPVYNNNPSFRIVNYDSTTKTPTDFSVYVLDIIAKNKNPTTTKFTLQYTAGELYGMQSHSNQNYNQLAHNFLSNNTQWDRFYQTAYRSGVSQPECSGKCRWDQVCAMTNIRIGDYNTCSTQYSPSPVPSPTPDPHSASAPMANQKEGQLSTLMVATLAMLFVEGLLV